MMELLGPGGRHLLWVETQRLREWRRALTSLNENNRDKHEWEMHPCLMSEVLIGWEMKGRGWQDSMEMKNPDMDQ